MVRTAALLSGPDVQVLVQSVLKHLKNGPLLEGSGRVVHGGLPQ